MHRPVLFAKCSLSRAPNTCAHLRFLLAYCSPNHSITYRSLHTPFAPQPQNESGHELHPSKTVFHSEALTQAKTHLRNRNTDKAIQCFQIASEKGSAEASLALCKMFQNGLFVAKNRERAIFYANEAAARNNAEAQFLLSQLHGNPKQSSHWLTQSAENGHMEARVCLSLSILRNNSNHQQSLKWITEAADANHVEALYYLGIRSVEQFKYDDAIAFFRRASDLLHRPSQSRLGILLFQLFDEKSEAMQWLTSAAENCPAAQITLVIAAQHTMPKNERHKIQISKAVDNYVGKLNEVVRSSNEKHIKLMESVRKDPSQTSDWIIKYRNHRNQYWCGDFHKFVNVMSEIK